MKVLVLPSWYPPYKGEFIQQQAEALAEQGHDVIVQSVERISPRELLRWLSAWCWLFSGRYTLSQEGPLTVARAPLPGIPKFYALYAELFALKSKQVFKRYRKVMQYQPDVIHAHSLIWAGYAASKIAKMFPVNYVVTEHRGRFINNQYVNESEKKEMSLVQVKKALQGASKVLCVSSKLIPYLQKVCPEAKLEVLANMVDVDRFIMKRSTVHQACQFICVAHVTPLKGHETLLQAFASVASKDKDVSLTIVGDGWYLNQVKELAVELNLENRVSFTGNLAASEVVSALQQADVFVLPSQYEAFGVVYIEAMSAGLPVIATNTGGAVDFVNKENGILVEPNNIELLANTMQYMRDNRAQYCRQTIAKLTKQRFSTVHIASQLSKHLQSVSEVK